VFEGFSQQRVAANGVEINLVVGGSGPALLLLHGYPQTHAIWRKVAPRLADRYTVVAADLRGYGDSSKPQGLPDHANYSKREMASDQVEAMRALGHESFYLVGHDRGARVSHRLTLAGLGFLALAMTSSLLLVLEVALGWAWSFALTSVVG